MKPAVLALVLLATAGAARGVTDEAAFKAAVELYSQRQGPEAERAFTALASAHPNDANIQFYLGRLALQRDDSEQATKYLEKAVALNSQDGRFHLRLGDAYGRSAQKAGLFSKMSLAGKCRTAYETAVSLDPTNVDARLSLMAFCQQAPSMVGGGMDKAYVQAAEIKKLDAVRGRLAFATLYTGEKKFTEAFSEYEAVVKERPDDYGPLFQLGRLAAISGEHLDQGLAALRRCLAQAPPGGQPGHAAVHWRIGNILEKQNDKAGARAAYEAALKIDPAFPQALDSLKKL